MASGCTRLFTEDLQHGRRSDRLEIANPFAYGSLKFRPSRMTRRYFPSTVTTDTVCCDTLRNTP